MKRPELSHSLAPMPKPHERLNIAITSIMEPKPWTVPAHKLFGTVASTRKAQYHETQTGSSLVVTQTREKRYVLGVPVLFGGISQVVTWTIREEPDSDYEAKLVYHSNDFFVGIEATYYRGSKEIQEPTELGYFYDYSATFPDPAINRKSARGYDMMTHLIENRLHQSFTEKPAAR